MRCGYPPLQFPPAASLASCARGSVPRIEPALKSCMASPASPVATATTAVTKKGLPGLLYARKFLSARSTRIPKISMGSIPVWPVMVAAMTTQLQTPAVANSEGTTGYPLQRSTQVPRQQPPSPPSSKFSREEETLEKGQHSPPDRTATPAPTMTPDPEAPPESFGGGSPSGKKPEERPMGTRNQWAATAPRAKGHVGGPMMNPIQGPWAIPKTLKSGPLPKLAV